jgi:hypothetical protein
MSYSFQVGRDAKTGEFITVEEAQRRKATAIVQTIKVPTPPRRKR